jgi:hypothetical protein
MEFPLENCCAQKNLVSFFPHSELCNVVFLIFDFSARFLLFFKALMLNLACFFGEGLENQKHATRGCWILF